MANEITIQVTGRDAGARQTITATAREADKLGGSVRRVGETIQGIMAAQMFQQIGRAASQFLGQARDASTNLGESVNAVNVTFKGAASGIHKIGQTASTSMGLSQNAFNAAAVRFSAFASTVAGPGGDVTATIRNITQRATDFASVMNLDVNKAMETFQSGLAGETEPLRRYGIDVSAAASKTFAYATGIAQAGAELTEAQKVQARYGLIMQQTSQMAGDFANTSDSLANSQRILAAEMENAQATVGGLMVPALQALNAVLIPVLQAFQDAPKPVQLVVGSLVLLGATIVAVTTRIAPMIIAMKAAGITMGNVATRARAATLAFGPLVATIAVITTVLSLMGRQSRETGNDITGLAKDLERLVDTGRITVEMQRLFGATTDDLAEKLRVASGNAHTQAGAVERMKQAWSAFPGIGPMLGLETARDDFIDLDNALVSIVESGTDADDALTALIKAYGLTDEQVQKLLELLPKFSTELDRSAEANRDAAGSIKEQVVALEDLQDQLKAQADPMFALIQAQRELKERQDAFTAAVNKFGRDSPQAQEALLALADAGLDVANASTKAQGAFDGKLSPSMRAALLAAGLTEEAINRLERQFDQAREAGDRFAKSYNARVNVHTSYTSSGRPPGSRPRVFFDAHGGNVGGIGADVRAMQTGGVSGSALGLVGEQGPELVRLPVGSTVIPTGQTRAMLAAGSGGGRLELVVSAEPGSGDDLMDALVRRLTFRVRRDAGGSVQQLLGVG